MDDDEFIRLIHAQVLSSMFECDFATNGEEATHKFLKALDDEQPYDLICMDIEMPVCNGHDAVSRIRAIEKERGVSKQSKIIMLSTLDDSKNVMESYLKGVTS